MADRPRKFERTTTQCPNCDGVNWKLYGWEDAAYVFHYTHIECSHCTNRVKLKPDERVVTDGEGG